MQVFFICRAYHGRSSVGLDGYILYPVTIVMTVIKLTSNIGVIIRSLVASYICVCVLYILAKYIIHDSIFNFANLMIKIFVVYSNDEYYVSLGIQFFITIGYEIYF